MYTLCCVFMICMLCCRVLHPAESYSLKLISESHPLASGRCRLRARRRARSIARHTDQVVIVMLPHRRVRRLNHDSPRRVLQERLVNAACWEGYQCPLGAQGFNISPTVPSVGPVSPALRDDAAVNLAAPFRWNGNLGTFLSRGRPVYRNTGSCFLQRATPRRELLLALRHRGMLGDRIVPTKRPMHCTMPAVQFCP